MIVVENPPGSPGGRQAGPGSWRLK